MLAALLLLGGLPACRRAGAAGDVPPATAVSPVASSVPGGAAGGLARLVAWDPAAGTGVAIVISISEQKLHLFKGGKLQVSYPISTSKFGVSSQVNSNQTPLGIHRIKSKIGDATPLGTVFVGRRATPQIATITTDSTPARGDLVTTRILWLDGQEDGRNRGPGVDSYTRCIYIHGTPEEGFIGRPASHGCIRMINTQVIHLFAQVAEGTPVLIQE